jgi:hypothetical protein
MRQKQPSISCLLLAVLSAIAFSNLSARPPLAKAATYDYVAPQIAPPVAINLGMAEIAAILNETAPNPPYLVAYQLTTTDANNTKAGLAPLKVVPTNDVATCSVPPLYNWADRLTDLSP